jgi:Delta14-sterol reductase
VSDAKQKHSPFDALAGKPRESEPLAFGGPIGGLAFMTLLPLLTVYLWICMHHHGGSLVLPSREVIAETPLPTTRALIYFATWLLFQVVLQLVLPGKTVNGLKARDGVTLKYKLNGFLSLWVSLAVLFLLVKAGVTSFTTILNELGPMLVIANVAAFALAAFLYWVGFRSEREEHRTGNALYDYFMGSSLNPRIHAAAPAARAVTPEGVELSAPTADKPAARTGGFDLKLFFESKIGMSTWLAITVAMAGAQLERDGSISLSMILVVLFQLFYVADFYFFENAMLSTWDINNENFGFMLGFGFVVWMPFAFSLQAQYLVYNRPELPVWAAVLIALLNFGGYYVFRTSNLQKHKFKTEPASNIWGRPASYLQTKRGTKLLTSGWWGLARHANYFGDLTMALAWCLPCGFSHVTPYFYFIYFAPLLIDRERRDNRACEAKYGDDWAAYCKRVPHRIVPYVY